MSFVTSDGWGSWPATGLVYGGLLQGSQVSTSVSSGNMGVVGVGAMYTQRTSYLFITMRNDDRCVSPM